MKNHIFHKFIPIVTSIVISTIAIFNVTVTSLAGTVENASGATGIINNTTANIDWPAAPSISAGSAILIDADTGAVLYDKDSHAKAYPASTTKLMTGLLTVENSSFDEVVTFSQAAAKSVVAGDANIATKVGEKYTVEQSLYALLLSSANEVAYGLAEHVAGSLPNFVDMMNTRAKQLGALNTHFTNASGLHDPNHYTTAYDLAMIGRGAFTNSSFLAVDSFTGTYSLGPTNLTPQVRSLYGNNQMFKGRQFYYQYCKGSKTGYTDESGYTLVSYAEKDGMKLLCVTLKESKPDDRYIDTKALFEYGFNNFKKVSITNSDISSLFNTSNYYNSKVYGNSTINFSMDSSYINLPSSASNLSGVGLSLNTNEAANDSGKTQGSENTYDFTAKLNFTYNGNIVGSAHLLVNTNSIVVKSENLPYVSNNNSETLTGKSCFVINIWYVTIGIGAILICIYIYIHLKQFTVTKKRRRYSKRKLRY